MNREVLRKIDAVEQSFRSFDRLVDHVQATLSAPVTLTTRELLAEADGLALRIARSNLPTRDVRIVQELAARLRSA